MGPQYNVCLPAAGLRCGRRGRFHPCPHPFKILNSKRDVGVENRILLRPSAEKSSTPILDGVENSSSDIQKCGFCLNLSAKQDFPPRYMDAYCGVENRVLLRPSTKKSSTLMMDGAVRQSRTMHILSSQKGAVQVSIDQHDDRLDPAK